MAAEPLLRALTRVRATVLDADALVRALGTGRRRGRQPSWRRVELRYVDLKAGRHLQVTTYDDTQAHTANHPVGPAATAALDALLEEPFGNWHVDTVEESLQVRVTKKGEALVHVAAAKQHAQPTRGHDRAKARLLPEDDPVLRALGIADDQGRIKPSRQAKYRQVEEFLRALDVAVTDALESGRLRTPTDAEPLRIVDLGCGNAYLTFAAHRHLTRRGLPVHVVGVDAKQQSYDHNTAVADALGIGESTSWVVASIEAADLDDVLRAGRPEIVLALHACDTATDEALARALRWEASLVLAAPCCHHDVAAQLRRTPTPAPYTLLTRHGILRERLADTLTDTVRAALLRVHGYRVDVMEFVESQHTPRNTLIRAVRSGAERPATVDKDVEQEYDALVSAWGIRPRLADLLS